MKTFFTFVFVLFTTIGFAQVSRIEQQLNTQEQELVQLKTELDNLLVSLKNQGVKPKISPQYQALKARYKARLGQVKTLRKQYKTALKAEKQASVSNESISAPSSSSVEVPKDRIKALKQQLKDLKKRRKIAVRQAKAVGQNPSDSQMIQRITAQIQQRENQLAELTGKPKISLPVITGPNMAQGAPPSDTERDVKQLKKEIKSLRKARKNAIKKALKAGINPVKATDAVQFNDQLYEKLKLYSLLTNQPPPARPTIESVEPNLEQPNQVINNQSVVEMPDSPANPDQKVLIKQAKKELRNLKKQQAKAVKSSIKNKQDPSKNPQVRSITLQVRAKERELEQLMTGQTVQTSGVATNKSLNVPSVESSYPVIGLSTILFEKFATELPTDYEKYINYVTKQLEQNPNLVLRIDAYTDNSEKGRTSLDLTTKMAKSVAQAFVDRGVQPNRLIVNAHGAKRPVGDNKTFFGQARNRRVELSFTGKLN